MKEEKKLSRQKQWKLLEGEDVITEEMMLTYSWSEEEAKHESAKKKS
ncbi:MAG: hypothetical protein IPL12_10565 [Bacteroidetes bacterium]|nr:hypothetical protein [Bacteroidota bacterium]